jgi:ADP-ribose pyrophosphatase YjhB (NUDIX family)
MMRGITSKQHPFFLEIPVQTAGKSCALGASIVWALPGTHVGYNEDTGSHFNY